MNDQSTDDPDAATDSTTSRIGEEATLLAQAIMDWTGRALATVDPAADRIACADSCALCPVCRVVQRVRERDPELAASLAAAIDDAASGVAKAVDIVRSHTTGTKPASDSSSKSDSEPNERERPPVKRIKIDRGDDE